MHATDVTNASRTMLMDLRTLDWHEPSLELMGIPRAMLPDIRSSSEVYGEAVGTALGGRPVAGIIGDQQAARAFAGQNRSDGSAMGGILRNDNGSEIDGSVHIGIVRRDINTSSRSFIHG